jgi:hypothetical protein
LVHGKILWPKCWSGRSVHSILVLIRFGSNVSNIEVTFACIFFSGCHVINLVQNGLFIDVSSRLINQLLPIRLFWHLFLIKAHVKMCSLDLILFFYSLILWNVCAHHLLLSYLHRSPLLRRCVATFFKCWLLTVVF